ncbi:MAG: GMC oxidoreductase [Chitinophagales bacterium]|nr:GMC family oxidoreductase [Bacteroidota bacterium]
MKTSLSRRKFVKLSALAGVASTLPLSGCKKTPLLPNDNNYSEAIVIGSGFGGSVAALRLGQAGIQTTMFEMGKEYDISENSETFCNMMKPDGRSTWLKNKTVLPITSIQFDIPKYTGVLDRVDFTSSYMKIYRGTCLGGGSVVYGAMLPYAEPSLWDEYFPFVDYSEMRDVWYPKVKSILNFSTVPDDVLNSQYYQYSRVGLEQCEKAGMQKVMLNAGVDFDIIRGEINGTKKRSATDGELLYGGNNGFKNSLDRNYIPAAKATGNLTIHTLHKVDSIKQLPNKKYEVTVHKINERGEVEFENKYTCTYLFVNAGVVGTMQILLKSKHIGGLPNLNDEVGKHWGNNGNIMAMRTWLLQDTGAQQCTVPVTAYGNLDNPITPLLAEQAPFPIGMELRQLLALAITKNPERGHFTYNPTTDNVDLHFDHAQMDISRKAMLHFVNQLNAANGGILESTMYFGGKALGDDFCYHPLGGAVLGLASDNYGRLKGYNNLYCLDGSMMPGFSCCANPALTIAGIAERSMVDILDKDIA